MNLSLKKLDLFWASVTATLKRNTTLTDGSRSFDPAPLPNRFRRWNCNYPYTSKSSSNTTSAKTYCYTKIYMIFQLRWNFHSSFIIVGCQHFHLMASAASNPLWIAGRSTQQILHWPYNPLRSSEELYGQHSMVLSDVADPGIRELLRKYRSITSECSFPPAVKYNIQPTSIQLARLPFQGVSFTNAIARNWKRFEELLKLVICIPVNA